MDSHPAAREGRDSGHGSSSAKGAMRTGDGLWPECPSIGRSIRMANAASSRNPRHLFSGPLIRLERHASRAELVSNNANAREISTVKSCPAQDGVPQICIAEACIP